MPKLQIIGHGAGVAALAQLARTHGCALRVLTPDSAIIEELGKQQGADIARDKATYPAMFGMDDANARVEELRQSAQEALAGLDIETESLQWVADLIVMRTY